MVGGRTGKMKKQPISVSAQQSPGQAVLRGHTSLSGYSAMEENMPVGETPTREFGGSKLHEALRWTGKQAGLHFFFRDACLAPPNSKGSESSWTSHAHCQVAEDQPMLL